MAYNDDTDNPRRALAGVRSDMSLLGGGLYQAIKLRAAAKLEVHMAQSEIMVAQAMERVAQAKLRAESEQRKLVVSRELWARNLDVQTALMDHALEMGRKELELNRLALDCEHLRSRRMSLSSGAAAPALGPATVEPEIDGGEIEAMALQAFAQASRLGESEEEQFWSEWERAADSLPANAAAQVKARARQLRDSSRR